MTASLEVTEIFHSIQGESTHIGRPCVFVRLTGCALRCCWCDTTFAYEDGEIQTLDAILERVSAFNCSLVEITGGEPLLQPRSIDLMGALLARGHEVLLETSGSEDISPVPRAVKRIVDMKAPGSGMSAHNRLDNLEYLRRGDELKLVVADRTDYQWARQLLSSSKLNDGIAIHLAPVRGVLAPATLADWILHDQAARFDTFGDMHLRMTPQLHAWVWPGEERGR